MILAGKGKQSDQLRVYCGHPAERGQCLKTRHESGNGELVPLEEEVIGRALRLGGAGDGE